MLVSVNDVANRLKITNRAVQIKCKREGLVKIGNQYQITEEIAQEWYDIAEAKPNEQAKRIENIDKISHPKRKEVRSFNSLIIIILIAVLCAVLFQFYSNLDDQINVATDKLNKNDIEHKVEVKDLNKRLNEADRTIHTKTLEIQMLKFKDSLRIIKKF
jgi:predicted transcriptional regulator